MINLPLLYAVNVGLCVCGVSRAPHPTGLFARFVGEAFRLPRAGRPRPYIELRVGYGIYDVPQKNVGANFVRTRNFTHNRSPFRHNYLFVAVYCVKHCTMI